MSILKEVILILFKWLYQGVLLESSGAKPGELYYTIIENIGDGGNRNGARSIDSSLPLLGEEDGESAVASMEDQLQQEMNVYEVHLHLCFFIYDKCTLFIINQPLV